MLIIFFLGALIGSIITGIILSASYRKRIRTIMRRQKNDPTWYEAKSDARSIGDMLHERALMYLPTLGVVFPDKNKIAAEVFHESVTYNWLFHFCDIVRQCACTLYIKPNDGPPMSIDEFRIDPKGLMVL